MTGVQTCALPISAHNLYINGLSVFRPKLMYNRNMELTPQEDYEQSRKKFVEDFEADPTRQIESQEKEEIEKHRVRLRREAGIIFDEALRYFKELAGTSQEAVESSIQVGLVQLPETKAIEITERIEEAERQFSPAATEEGYRAGSAKKPDELIIHQGEAPVLLTAEHATEHIRTGEPKEADWGTGGLMSVLATDHGTFAIAPLGMQTGDANHAGEHTIKTESGIIIVQRGLRLAMTIHGIGPTKFVTTEQMDKLLKAAAVYQLPDISAVGEAGVVKLVVRDKKNDTSNDFSIIVGETDSVFTFNFKVENIKILPGTYEVVVSQKLLSRFQSKNHDLCYYIALEPDSTFG